MEDRPRPPWADAGPASPHLDVRAVADTATDRAPRASARVHHRQRPESVFPRRDRVRHESAGRHECRISRVWSRFRASRVSRKVQASAVAPPHCAGDSTRNRTDGRQASDPAAHIARAARRARTNSADGGTQARGSCECVSRPTTQRPPSSGRRITALRGTARHGSPVSPDGFIATCWSSQ